MNGSLGTKIWAKWGSWKEALHETVYRSTLPAKAIADGLGVHMSTLQKACDEAQIDNLSAKHLSGLVQLADNLACLDYLEERAGRVAFALPKTTDALLGKQTADAIVEFGEWLRAQSEAAADGIITPEECATVSARSEAVIKVVAAVRELFRQRSTRYPKAAGDGR